MYVNYMVLCNILLDITEIHITVCHTVPFRSNTQVSHYFELTKNQVF